MKKEYLQSTLLKGAIQRANNVRASFDCISDSFFFSFFSDARYKL